MSLVLAGEPQAGPRVEWSVAALAAQLCVPAAHLRRWDQRYGVGPTGLTADRQRRYGEEDVQRVQVALRLTSRGLSPLDAARVALSADSKRLQAFLA